MGKSAKRKAAEKPRKLIAKTAASKAVLSKEAARKPKVRKVLKAATKVLKPKRVKAALGAGSGAAGYSADAYRRAARRLRHRYRGQPDRLHQALRKLAADETSRVAPPGRPDYSPASELARAVVASMDGPFLRYSARQRLLSRAARLGISRFEANLIIAAVQHRVRAGGDESNFCQATSRISHAMKSAGLALVIQALIIAAIWMLVR